MTVKSQKKEKTGALSIKNVTKIYDPSGVNVKAVDDCSMEIAAGEVCMIVAVGGAAVIVSTLLHGVIRMTDMFRFLWRRGRLSSIVGAWARPWF